MRQPSEDEFLKNVARHALTIVFDQDCHRHLTLRDPATFHSHFHITTWPGYLTISGDMGCFVFARLRDMFEFFRGREINPQYWAQKLQSDSRYGGHEQFSDRLFEDAVRYHFDNWSFDSKEQRERAWSYIKEGLINRGVSTVQEAVIAGMDYECPATGNRLRDFWDHRFTDYSYQFIWCCRAIQWAIAQYDSTKARPPAEAA